MKKTLTYIILLLSALTFTGCDKESVTETKNNSVITDTSCYENRILTATSNIAESENGYYILRYEFAHYIMYASKKNNQIVYLCSKANCEHTDKWGAVLSTCDSYVGDVMPASIKCYNDKIYILKYDNHKVSLVEISKDGSGHKHICEIGKAPDMTSGLYEYIIHKEYAYVISSPESVSDSEPFELFRISLETGEKETIYETVEYKRTALKMYKGNLYYIKRKIKYEDSEKKTYSLCRYNITDNSEEELINDIFSNYTINNANDTLLYWCMDKGLMQYDIKSEKTDLIKKIDENSKSVWLCCNGKYIFIDNQPTKRYSDKFIHTLEILDANSNELCAVVNNDMDNDSFGIFGGTGEFIISIFTETGLKQYYLPITDIEAGKNLEWKMFEE